jgi:hypothetical protein
MDNSSILKAFVNHFDEFIEDILKVYPQHPKLLKCKLYFDGLKKTNPKIIIIVWKEYVNSKYRDMIHNGDVNFFIGKDFGEDIQDLSNSNKVHKEIEELRSIVKTFSDDNLNKSMKYIQNLTKLSDMYN